MAALRATTSDLRSEGCVIVIARAPLRISLAGDGTDVESYYSKYGGAAVTASIDKYTYALVSRIEADHVRVASSDYQGLFQFDSVPWDGDLRASQAVIKHFGVHRGVSVFLAPELPPHTGLATFTAGTVALIRAMGEIRGHRLTQAEMAELAYQVEIDEVAIPIGKQDAYAASFGGLNFITFADSGVQVNPITLSSDALFSVQSRLMLFFTGRYQRTSEAIAEYKRASERNRATVIEALHQIRSTAYALREDLEHGDTASVGQRLNQTWRATRQLAPGMTDGWIDQWCEMALDAGASGAKPSGLGAAGFLVVFSEPKFQPRVKQALQSAGLSHVDLHLESEGATVLLNEDYPVSSDPEIAGSTRGAR